MSRVINQRPTISMVAKKGHPKPLEKAAAAIEMPQRQLQSRSGNQDAAAAITKPKRQWRCRSGNCKAEAAIQMPLRQLKSRSGNWQFFTSLQYNHSVWAYGGFLILIARLVPGHAFRSCARFVATLRTFDKEPFSWDSMRLLRGINKK